MSQAVDRFIRQILNKHARVGLDAITNQACQSATEVVAVTIVLPELGPEEHSVYEWGLAILDNNTSHGGFRGRHPGSRDVEWLRGNRVLLQRFIDALKNEQSVVELQIEHLTNITESV